MRWPMPQPCIGASESVFRITRSSEPRRTLGTRRFPGGAAAATSWPVGRWRRSRRGPLAAGAVGLPVAGKDPGGRSFPGRARVVGEAGPKATARFLEFFAGRTRTRGRGRRTGGRAIPGVVRGLRLRDVSPLHVAAYIRTHPGSAPTVKQHLAAIRMLGDWLVVSQVLPVNPVAAVWGPKHSSPKARRRFSRRRRRGSSSRASTRAPWPGFGTGRSSRSLLYSFARVSVMLGMRRQDSGQGSRVWLRLYEKGGKRHDVPAHHRAAAALDAYVEAGGLEEPKAALFQTVDPVGRRLTDRALDRRLVLGDDPSRSTCKGRPAW